MWPKRATFVVFCAPVIILGFAGDTKKRRSSPNFGTWKHNGPLDMEKYSCWEITPGWPGFVYACYLAGDSAYGECRLLQMNVRTYMDALTFAR